MSDSVMKTVGFLIVLAIAVVLTPQAAHALIYLPDSTYAETQHNWQGQREYTEDTDDGLLKILVEYTVYDTENLLKLGEKQLVESLDLSGRYVYAYQIWNHPTQSTEEVIAFELLYAETKLKIPASAFEPYNDTHSSDDGHNGVTSTPQESTIQGKWTFIPGDLKPGTHSWFLVFSSDFAPVKGDFEIKREEGDMPGPGDKIPEPNSIALLGAAVAWLAAMRKRK
jgi:hypothetical protein